MASMRFKTFTWMDLPENLKIRVVRAPEYQVDEDGKYKGFLSKSRVLNTYRQMLVDFSED